MTANDDAPRPNAYQVGGRHYMENSYQHWDFVVDTGQDYLAGNATKYLSRWRKKGGRADLEKAQHYVAKLCEVADRLPQRRRPLPLHVDTLRSVVASFTTANDLSELERRIIQEIVCWQTASDVVSILQGFPEFIRLLTHDGSDPVPVPLTEENHHASYPPPEGDPLGR